MARRKAWNGDAPATPADARHRLLLTTQECIERHGHDKVGLGDVAAAAGVTRQTVYRYFADVDELFTAAATYASGGLIDEMRSRATRHESTAERIVETLVTGIVTIPTDEHLRSIATSSASWRVSAMLASSFPQEQMRRLFGGDIGETLSDRDHDEIAELLLRLLKSFLYEPDLVRTEDELRAFLFRWLVPAIDARIAANTASD